MKYKIRLVKLIDTHDDLIQNTRVSESLRREYLELFELKLLSSKGIGWVIDDGTGLYKFKDPLIRYMFKRNEENYIKEYPPILLRGIYEKHCQKILILKYFK